MAMIKCEKCGHEVEEGSIVCMHCGHGLKKLETDYDLQKMEVGSKKSSIGIARVFAFLALFMNIITICLSFNDSALRYVCMLTAIVCAAVSLVLVIMSFSITKKNSEDEINEKVGIITKAVIGVLIFSGADFFVAVSTSLFGF